MKRTPRIPLLAGATLLVVWTAASRHSVHAQDAGPLVMVVSKSSPAGAALSKAEAKRLLLGQTTSWPGGSKVVVVLKPAGSKERTTLLQKLCGMSEAEFTRYQIQVAFTGRPGTQVHEAPTAAAEKAYLKSNAAAVGFLHSTEVGDDLKAVLTIE